jgi:hypothetical protein
MSKKQKKAKGKQVLSQIAKQRPFIDGYDSYADEYDRWKRMNVVKGLVGIFELDDGDLDKDIKDLPPKLGLGIYKQIFHTVEVDNSVKMNAPNVKGSGWTSAVKDNYGRVRPIIFVGKNVRLDSDHSSIDEQGERTRDSSGVIQLLVLMHELGHAEDIARGVNYNHVDVTLDIVAAEFYAHRFVLLNARKLGYRFALKNYIDHLELGLNSANDAVRLSSERVMSELDIAKFKEASQERTNTELKIAFEKSGRLKEFLRSLS